MPSTLLLLGLAALAVAKTQSGCGCKPPLNPGTSQNFTIKSSGGTREYILFLPTGYDSNKPMPLVVNYHGHSDSDAYQEEVTKLDDPFFNADHIVAYPQGTLGTDGQSSWSSAPYAKKDVDDLVFTTDLLDAIEKDYCVDTTRVFATGKSNGGGFVNYLACHSESARFTAFAPVAGAYYPGFGADGDACKPTRSPQPILEIHGYNDTTIPYAGGTHGSSTLPAVLDWIRDWAKRNGCGDSNGNMTTIANGMVDFYDFGCNTQHYAVRNAEHVWESTVPTAETERYKFGPSAINASSVVMDFFRAAQPLPAKTRHSSAHSGRV